MFVNATLRNLELNIGNLATSACELDDIDIEISVLTPMKRIHSIDEFQLGKQGIFMRKGYHAGTFLPQVIDEVARSKEKFLGHCDSCRWQRNVPG